MRLGGMTRDEMLARMSSQELTGWLALLEVENEEIKHRRDIAESGDGIVHYYGRDDDEGLEDDGPTE